VPVAKKFWKQHELWDGTYTLEDFLDIMELITVMDENEYREQENSKLQQQLQGGG